MSSEELPGTRIDAPADPRAFYELGRELGFGDGLPLFVPTDDTVRALLDATPHPPEHVLGALAPANVECSVMSVAVNAAMAGVAPIAFGYVIAALEAIMKPPFNWSALAATTSSVTPALIVNGPKRAECEFDMETGCMGGAAGRGSMTVGRAVQLCLRNIGGQKVGVTSKSVWGQPARSVGLCFAEWEEESPWPPLSVQRGYTASDEVVTIHGVKGTLAFADIHNDDARDLFRLVARSLAFPLSTMFLGPEPGTGETVVCLNPVWAARFAAEFPDVRDAQAFLQENAWQPADLWPDHNRAKLEEYGRVDAKGRVHLAARPDQWIIVVGGGRGSLHSVALTAWAGSMSTDAMVVR